MPLMATENSKLTAYVPERVRRALGIVAAAKGKTLGQVITALAEQHFQAELEQADRHIAAGEEGRGKPGRKPRAD